MKTKEEILKMSKEELQDYKWSDDLKDGKGRNQKMNENKIRFGEFLYVCSKIILYIITPIILLASVTSLKLRSPINILVDGFTILAINLWIIILVLIICCRTNN